MNRIREAIKAKGMTQAELAAKLGISRVALNNQLDKPSYPTLEKIAVALDVPIWQLFKAPAEVLPLTALVEFDGKTYAAHTAEELEDILNIIKGK